MNALENFYSIHSTSLCDDIEDHPFYPYFVSHTMNSTISDDMTLEKRSNLPLSELTMAQKYSMTCDEVFTLFIKEMCKKINMSFASVLIAYVNLYREVVNEFGPSNRGDNDKTHETPDKTLI